jgi:hypothetical protein
MTGLKLIRAFRFLSFHQVFLNDTHNNNAIPGITSLSDETVAHDVGLIFEFPGIVSFLLAVSGEWDRILPMAAAPVTCIIQGRYRIGS